MATPPLHLDVIAFLDDPSVLDEYQRTDEAPGNSLADDLLVETDWRNLDI